jgi:hypothetical protein
VKKHVFLAVSMLSLGIVALAVAGGLVKAQDEGDPDAMEPVAVLSTYEMMEVLVEPQFEALKTAVATEPADRAGWVAVYDSSYALGELMNLLFSRTDVDYAGEETYKKMTVDSRKKSVAVAEAVKKQDYELVKANYIALVESCNACHVEYEKDIAPILVPFGEE